MWRHLETMWDSFFPHEPVYPLQLAGSPQDLVSTAELEASLRLSYRLFSYRTNFEPIESTTTPVSSDQGWGCLLRTTQMMLAHFLLKYAEEEDTSLNLFLDRVGPQSAFSVHNMIKHVWDKRAFRAEYWSPSQACEAVRRCVDAAVKDRVLTTPISVVTSTYGSVYSEDVETAFRGGAKVVLLLVPVRVSPAPQLGQETYIQLQGLLSQPASLGMVGGIPGKSYYFFGHSQTQLLYLDPHQRVQPALLSAEPGQTGVVVPGLADARCVHWQRVDTSLYLAFAVRNRNEWGVLKKNLPTKFLCVEEKRLVSSRKLKSDLRQRDNVFVSPLHSTSLSSIITPPPPQSRTTRRKTAHSVTTTTTHKTLPTTTGCGGVDLAPAGGEVADEKESSWDLMSEVCD